MKIALRTTNKIPWFRSVILCRTLGACFVIYALHSLFDLGSPPLFLSIGGALGVTIASYASRTRLNGLGALGAIASVWVASTSLFYLLELLVGGLFTESLVFSSLQLHCDTFLIAFSISFISTWLFWRVRSAVTWEAVTIAATAIGIFSAHRNFRFDRPKVINSLAWRWGLDHLTTLMFVGSGVLLCGIIYLFLASQAIRPKAEGRHIQQTRLRKQLPALAIELVIFLGLAFWAQRIVYQHFNIIMLDRVANGVGMKNESGVSPLSFQSALGSSNQPAALVRLEGDYTANPFSPMVYLRESALSQFAGREMVFAGRAFDTDLPAIAPQDTFTGKEDPELQQRTPVVQSVYLLAQHDNSFALDYPVSIVQLKNPKPERFKNTYRAYSIAPSFSQADLNILEVGDPRWAPEVKKHYLVEHPDVRYKELVLQITKELASPVQKVRAITDYLSQTSIYTLTPHHDTKPSDDPVAPFLFGDHRGYCVHFAHAVVYMARALGIPARIGTGYLTDLSQAKDGHILLRMSDRHAWGEIFITGIGWVPFDVKPERVESHADSQVDTKLLEELMGILEPGEELLPESSIKDEPGVEEPDTIWMPEASHLTATLYGLTVFLILSKCWLRYRWLLTNHPQRRLKWGYIAIASMLYDGGTVRSSGETRNTFAQRSHRNSLHELSALVVNTTYEASPFLQRQQIDAAMNRAILELKTLPWHTKAWAAINPAATFRFLMGAKW